MSDLSAVRTLVKSPPELWSELSDPQSLAKHLGEFGEIRITKLEPEHTVAWEGDLALGTARIEPSGWGTKVTITARLAGIPDEPVTPVEPAPVVEDPGPDPELTAAEAALSEAKAELEGAERKYAAASEEVERARPAEPEEDAEPPAKPGFFARLFGAAKRAEEERLAEAERKAKKAKEAEQRLKRAEAFRDAAAELKAKAEARLSEAESRLEAARAAAEERRREAEREAERRLARWREHEARRRAAEAGAQPRLDPKTSQSLLEQVLDHLGSAHHRPFSRS